MIEQYPTDDEEERPRRRVVHDDSVFVANMPYGSMDDGFFINLQKEKYTTFPREVVKEIRDIMDEYLQETKHHVDS